MKIDRDYLFSTLADLIRINSINPTLAAGGKGEAEIGEYVAACLARWGCRCAKLEPEPGRVSVLGTLTRVGRWKQPDAQRALRHGRREGMEEPFSAAVRDGKMFGRGSYDMKGSLAAQMAAVKALQSIPARSCAAMW